MMFNFNLFGSRNQFAKDGILKQERFEPVNWVLPLKQQVEILQNKYLLGCVVDAQYLEACLKRTAKRGYVQVAVPKMTFLANRNAVADPFAEIGVLMEDVCVLLGEQREGKFTHYRKGQLGPNRFRCMSDLAERRRVAEAEIPGDIVVFNVDMGNTYAGWTPRRAREDIRHKKTRIALSSVDISWIVLVNPLRFQQNTDLSVDSVMEEYLSEDRGWVTNIFFYHRGGKLECGYRWNRRAYFDCGAVHALLVA